MYRLKLKGSAAHALFHVMQRVDTLLKELEFLDLHQISVHCVNDLFIHGLHPSCHDQEVGQALIRIHTELPARAAGLPELPEWHAQYRTGLVTELTGLLHQGLGLVKAYRTLPDELPVSPPPLHTAEGVIGHHGEDHHGMIKWDGTPGSGPWG